MKKLSTILLSSACAALLLPVAVQAESISDFTITLTSSNSTQLGRPSRNQVPQDWAGDEAYPGVINTAVTYYYGTYSFSSALFTGAPFVEITDDEPNNTYNYFLSAYANSYDPNDRSANWLGDVGFTGNYQYNDGGDMQVILPAGDSLVLVANTVVGGRAGLQGSLHVSVNAYADTMYDDPAPATVTPEPSSFLLLGTGLSGAVALVRRRTRLLA